jgi:hypothetical protein
MKMKRLIISLIIGALSGLFCIFWTYLEMSGFETTIQYLITIFYNRLLIGFVVGISNSLKIINRNPQNTILRGAIIGAIISVALYIQTGSLGFIPPGIVFGAIADFLATKYGS